MERVRLHSRLHHHTHLPGSLLWAQDVLGLVPEYKGRIGDWCSQNWLEIEVLLEGVQYIRDSDS